MQRRRTPSSAASGDARRRRRGANVRPRRRARPPARETRIRDSLAAVPVAACEASSAAASGPRHPSPRRPAAARSGLGAGTHTHTALTVRATVLGSLLTLRDTLFPLYFRCG